MIRTRMFRISRPEFVRVASLHYARTMWPVFVAVPVFGILALGFGANNLVRALGLLALLWPATIPGRVALASWGRVRRLLEPTWVGLDAGVLYFHDEQGSGMKLPLEQVRRVRRLAGMYVFETRRFNFALVPVDAVEDADRAGFERAIGIEMPRDEHDPA